jgi:hypothetical protein
VSILETQVSEITIKFNTHKGKRVIISTITLTLTLNKKMYEGRRKMLQKSLSTVGLKG